MGGFLNKYLASDTVKYLFRNPQKTAKFLAIEFPPLRLLLSCYMGTLCGWNLFLVNPAQ